MGGGWREGGLCGIQEEKGVVICPWNCLIAFIWTEIYYFTVGFGTQLVEVETCFFTPPHFPLLHFNCFMPEIIKSSTTWKVTSIYLRTIPFKLTNVESYHQFLFSFDQSWALKIEKIPCFFCHIHGSHVATVTIFGSWNTKCSPKYGFFCIKTLYNCDISRVCQTSTYNSAFRCSLFGASSNIAKRNCIKVQEEKNWNYKQK